MTTVKVGDQTIKFPDSMSPEDIKAALKGNTQKLPSPKQSYAGGVARSALQGMTFGGSDEVGAGIAALFGSISTGEPFSVAYDKIHSQLAQGREDFRADNPAASTVAEIAGGVATGGAGLGRTLASQTVRNAPRAARIGAVAGVGGAEGAVYGALSADQNQRDSGAVTGGVTGAALGPVAAGAANVVGKGIGGVTNYAANKLGSTPRGQAVQVLRDAADAVGMTADDAAERYAKLGRQGTLADIDESMRMTGRAAMNRQGTARSQGQSMVMTRDRAQGARLQRAIEESAGDAASYGRTMTEIIERRKTAADPLYAQAREVGVQMSEGLEKLLADELFKPSYQQGQRWAVSEGQSTLMDVLHQAKLHLDDQISKHMRKGERNRAAKLLERKSALMEAMGPEYRQAASVYAGESALKDSLELGRNIFKMKPDEIEAAVAKMGESELELVRLGGVRAVADILESIGESRDAVKRLTDSPANKRRLALILGDDASKFLERVGIEEQFSQTKNALVGNSTTELQQQIGRALDGGLDEGMVSAIRSASGANVLGATIDVLTKAKATPEVINEIGNLLFAKGLSEREVRNIFQAPAIRRAFGDEYDRIIAPYVQAMAAPAIVSQQQ